MDTVWKVILYKDRGGDKPVEKFILSLELKSRTKVYNSVRLLESFGISVGPPHVKKLTGTALWELRIVGADSIRIFYVTITGKTFLLLHGFKKKQDKTPSKEIKVALFRLAEFKSSK